MKTVNLITLILTIVAGLDVGVVGLTTYDPIAVLLGGGSAATRVVETVLGLCALYQLRPFFKALSAGEIPAEAARA